MFHGVKSGNTFTSNHPEPSGCKICEAIQQDKCRLQCLQVKQRMGKTKGLDLPQDPTDQSGELPSLVTVDGE